MVKFWKMLIAMFAMMAMVVVPTSCGDDDDDDEKNGSNTSSNPVAGKMFVEEDEHWVDIYVFDNEIVTRYDESDDSYYKDTRSYRYEILSNGQITFNNKFYRYNAGELIRIDDGDEWVEAVEDKTGRSVEQILKDWEEAQPISPYGDAKVQVYVQPGQKYQAVQAGTTAFSFEVKSCEGTVYDKNQVVTFVLEKNGRTQTVSLGDDAAHYSYLAWTEADGFKGVNKAYADTHASEIVMILAGASNVTGVDYMITTPTINKTLQANGAVETLFR
ncbi:MAG: hypothetical protein MJY63_00020 [Paludibacteraceae bacterium]|nr:hypothetical protein [Paludibacteraceae bacterium]